MPKKERESLFVEMFRAAKPFEDSIYYKSDSYQKLEYEYAFQSIELLRRYDAEMREIDRKKVQARAGMDTYRDYHYFVQGIDQLIEYLRARLPTLDQLIEGVNIDQTEKGPLS